MQEGKALTSTARLGEPLLVVVDALDTTKSEIKSVADIYYLCSIFTICSFSVNQEFHELPYLNSFAIILQIVMSVDKCEQSL